MNLQALRRPAAWVWLAAMLLGAWLATRATYVADLSAFLPSSPSAEQRVLLEQLRHGVTARVMLVGVRGGDAALRGEASRGLATALRASGEFDSVNNGDNLGAPKAVGELLMARRYLLSPAVDAQRFSVDGLRDGIADTTSMLGTPAGAWIKPLLWRDPTGEMARLAETLLPSGGPRVEAGVWVSRSQPRALLVAITRAGGSDLDGQAQAIDTLHRAFEPWAARGLSLDLSGAGVLGVQSRTLIKAEVERLALWDGAIVLALLLLAFGSLKALGVALLPVASGVLAGTVAVSLGFGQVHGMTLGFGTTLIGEAVDYAIYYLVQARSAPGTGAGALHWRRHNWPTVRWGLLTSLAGFSALVFSGFGGLAQLGVFSVAGLLAAALTTRYVLTDLAPDGAPGLGLRMRLGEATARMAGALPRLRWFWGGLGAAALALLLVLPSAWRGQLTHLSPVSKQALTLDASLRADLGAAELGTLVAIEAPDEATALQRAEQASARLDPLVAAGLLAGYESPTRLLPSAATQAARQAALPDADTLRARLKPATADGLLPADRLEPFIADVQAQRQARPVTRADYDGTPLATALQAQLLPGTQGRPWTVLLSLRAGTQALPAARLRDAMQGLPDTRVVEIQPELDALYARYLREAFWQSALGALAVLLILYAGLRSLRRLWRVALPLVASVVLVLAGLTLAGVALGVLHLVGLLLVVAVGSNYALFFDQLAQQGPEQGTPQADAETLASLLLANLTIVASFALLCSSSVPLLVALGEVVAPGTLLCLLLSASWARRTGGVGQSEP
ncbi:MMPL family transporter [Rhizobacter sp. OV335]|uniref:MMPL family transporter n=1 Tax=Rhizobacter sp. OV335 TaxID=1500264 RepID=UPI000912A2B7|nr:MMPL family transporter [Rhizobacter sp. OV335]SHM49253.1 Predicted exporter [Rhizobacter sp. OV335]